MKIGKLEKDMLKFLNKYKSSGMHSISKDSITKKVSKSLRKKRLIKINKYHQAKITKKGESVLKSKRWKNGKNRRLQNIEKENS